MIAASEHRATERDYARFFMRVRFALNGCWEWTGAMSAKGYGSFGYAEKAGQGGMAAHRASYRMFVGPIPDGLVIDHRCRNRSCVNPWHLEAVTDRENILRGEGPAANAARRTHCDQGHEFTSENTIWRTDRNHPARRCRTCLRERRRRRV